MLKIITKMTDISFADRMSELLKKMELAEETSVYVDANADVYLESIVHKKNATECELQIKDSHPNLMPNIRRENLVQ